MSDKLKQLVEKWRSKYSERHPDGHCCMECEDILNCADELEAALSASPVTLTEELREAATRLLHEVELYRGECGYRLSPGSGKFAADIEMVANAMLSPAAQPSPLTVSEEQIQNYRNAPGGIGPFANEWKDKPHRLIYDLCDALEAKLAPSEKGATR